MKQYQIYREGVFNILIKAKFKEMEFEDLDVWKLTDDIISYLQINAQPSKGISQSVGGEPLQSFQFLNDPKEDIYTMKDGEAIESKGMVEKETYCIRICPKCKKEYESPSFSTICCSGCWNALKEGSSASEEVCVKNLLHKGYHCACNKCIEERSNPSVCRICGEELETTKDDPHGKPFYMPHSHFHNVAHDLHDFISDFESGIAYLKMQKQDYGYGHERLLKKIYAIKAKLSAKPSLPTKESISQIIRQSALNVDAREALLFRINDKNYQALNDLNYANCDRLAQSILNLLQQKEKE